MQTFQTTVCSSLHLLRIRVSRCCCKTVFTPVCVQVSSEKEKTTKFYPARSLQLKTVPFLFWSYSVLNIFLKITLLNFTRTQMPKLRMAAVPGSFHSRAHSKLNTGLKTPFCLEEQGGRQHKKTKFPPSSLCAKHTSTFPGCSAFTQLHPWGKMRIKKVKDHLRTAHVHHTNTASKTEISGQIMNKMANADDYFKPPVGRKERKEGEGGRQGKQRKNLSFPRYRENLGRTQRERLATYFCDFSWGLE